MPYNLASAGISKTSSSFNVANREPAKLPPLFFLHDKFLSIVLHVSSFFYDLKLYQQWFENYYSYCKNKTCQLLWKMCLQFKRFAQLVYVQNDNHGLDVIIIHLDMYLTGAKGMEVALVM